MVAHAVVEVLGWLAVICFALLLTPQIYLNQTRKSTEGLSLSLIILWHMASGMVFPYLLFHHEPIALLLQWGLFCLASIIIELQFVGFRPHRSTCQSLFIWGIIAIGASIGVVYGLYAIFQEVSNTPAKWLIEVLGSYLSSVALAVGFLPQIYLMIKEKSSEGFSMGLSALDLCGSMFSILVVILKGHPNIGAIVPYAVIVAFQVIMVFLATVVFPDRKRFAPLGKVKEALGLKKTEGSDSTTSSNDKEQIAANGLDKEGAAAEEEKEGERRYGTMENGGGDSSIPV